jgi:hypothetical protein
MVLLLCKQQAQPEALTKSFIGLLPARHFSDVPKISRKARQFAIFLDQTDGRERNAIADISSSLDFLYSTTRQSGVDDFLGRTKWSGPWQLERDTVECGI